MIWNQARESGFFYGLELRYVEYEKMMFWSLHWLNQAEKDVLKSGFISKNKK